MNERRGRGRLLRERRALFFIVAQKTFEIEGTGDRLFAGRLTPIMFRSSTVEERRLKEGRPPP